MTSGPSEDPSRALRQELPRLARREARLVHQPAALVGASDSDLVLRRPAPRATCERAFGGRDDVVWRAGEAGGWLICAETDLARRRARPGPHADAGPRRPRHLVQLGPLAALDARLAGGDARARRSIYPTSVLSTARDIITLWVARMVIFGLFNMRRRAVPRRLHSPGDPGRQGPADVEVGGQRRRPGRHHRDLRRRCPALHAGRRRDRDPGPADARRERSSSPTAATINTSERFEQGRNFANKFWNAARLALMNLEGYDAGRGRPAIACRSRTAGSSTGWTARSSEVTADLEQFQFAEAARRLRDFTWGDFCDWYVEFVKGRLRDPAAQPDRPARAGGGARRRSAGCFTRSCRS